MKPTTEQKLVNTLGDEKLAVAKSKAIQRGEWISRHCNTLYITKYDKGADAFSYFIEKKSNRLHKFRDLTKIGRHVRFKLWCLVRLSSSLRRSTIGP